jgi:hypothetical protein
MRHIRPLPPIDDPDQDWFLASGTALFATTPEGLEALKSHVESHFRVDDYEDAPIDLVLCTGALDPDGLYTTIRRVERRIDLIDEWAPIGSDVPDPSLESLRSNYDRLKSEKEDGSLKCSDEAARWYLQKMQDDIYRIEAQLAEKTEIQEEMWGDDYPSLFPERERVA